MRFRSLGSGSSGNATLVEAHDGAATSRVLVDCGFTLRELEGRLARCGLAVDALEAVFVTHEHGDHVGCAIALARRHRVPLWMSRGTWRAIGEPVLDAGLLHIARDGEAITLAALELRPYTVPHDAAEPLQLSLDDGVVRLGILTDAGSITDHLLQALRDCSALLLECNHDPQLLAASRYPASLKARIGGRLGHLANASAAEILRHVAHPGLRHVVAAHLSEQNNRPELASQALAAALGTEPADIVVADAAQGFDWLGLR
ncbi:MBL fold metallo-hydrolase [Rivibacter subsaxonicus]|uniref:Phosphoribosyl 1,2-cyclic phosphodiesterase n=1 Tax=Rivibacter subsaxonicus TaxID=457575 RepID=A0A4Q7VNF6_9BURK|nr:MBL fold metallo-hydrolase [Rivibacter subsaxonicus]RZT97883.1 phosphoribosyl 1,2-cyclic phosphodiesterase [Rivibacter subsaxonicus]